MRCSSAHDSPLGRWQRLYDAAIYLSWISTAPLPHAIYEHRLVSCDVVLEPRLLVNIDMEWSALLAGIADDDKGYLVKRLLYINVVAYRMVLPPVLVQKSHHVRNKA